MDSDVETILSTVVQECSKLEVKGHDYFLVMSDHNLKQVLHFGSDKGRQFLDDNADLIHKFLDHCYKAAVNEVSRPPESTCDADILLQDNTETGNNAEPAIHAERTEDSVDSETTAVGRKGKLNDSVDDEENKNVDDTEIANTAIENDDSDAENDDDTEPTVENVSENCGMVTESVDRCVGLNDSINDHTYDLNDEKDDEYRKDDVGSVVSSDPKATADITAEENEEDASNFLQQINLTPLKKATKADISLDTVQPMQVNESAGESGVKRSNRLKIKRELREEQKQKEMEKSAKKPKLDKRKPATPKGRSKEVDNKDKTAQGKKIHDSPNVVLMPVKFKLSGTEKVQEGLRVCKQENKSLPSDGIQKVKIVKVFVGKQGKGLESLHNSGKGLVESPKIITKKASAASKTEDTDKSTKSVKMSTAGKDKTTKKAAKSGKTSTAGKAKRATKSAKVSNKVKKPKMIKVEGSEKNKEKEEEYFESDDEDGDEDGLALYESKVKDTSWKPTKKKSRGKAFSAKKGKRSKRPLYECEKCGLSTISKGAYVKHMLVHTLTNCKHCGEMPTDEEDMKQHKIKCWKRAYREKLNQTTVVGDEKYACDICKRVCFSAGALQRHKTVHSLKCKFCKQTFEDENSIKLHKNDCAAKKKVYRANDEKRCCNKCGRLCYNKGSYMKHMEVHKDDDGLRCFYCGENFDSDDVFMKHVTECEYRRQCLNSDDTGKTDVKLKCNMCDVKFSSQKSLHTHLLLMHYNKPSEREFKCSFCHKILANKYSKINHEKLAHSDRRDHVCNICGKAVKTKSSLYKHKFIFHSLKTPGQFKCNKCGKEFKCKLYLTKHMFVHSDRKLHKCEICSKVFSSLSYLKNHLKYIHIDTRDHVCDICGKAYKKKGYLLDHIKIAHGTEADKPFECEICKKRFPRRFEYKNHKRIHTGEKPYICEVCGKGFVQEGNMRKHRKSMHPQDIDKIYVCDLCGKSTRLQENYQNHMRLHMIKLGKVEEVGKRYGKFYHCKICSRYFSQSGRLAIHMRSHTGERPYVCNGCNRCYISSSKLSRHRKRCKLLPYRYVENKKSAVKPRVVKVKVDNVMKVDNWKEDKPKEDKTMDQSQAAAEAVQNLVASLVKEVKQEQNLTENEEGVIEGVIHSVSDFEAQQASNILMENEAAARVLTENNAIEYVNATDVAPNILFVVNQDDVALQGTEYVVIESTAEDIPLIHNA